MNKYAAEKIASEYYDAGLQLALHQAGLVKQANISEKILAMMGKSTPAMMVPKGMSTSRKAMRGLGLGSIGALAPAALAERGFATSLGKAELEMLRQFMRGEGKAGLEAAKGIIPGAQSDASMLMDSLKLL